MQLSTEHGQAAASPGAAAPGQGVAVVRSSALEERRNWSVRLLFSTRPRSAFAAVLSVETSGASGMLTAGGGTVITAAGMLAFSGPTDAAPAQGQRAKYVATLAGTVAFSQVLSAELAGAGVTMHAVCPGVVATEFHEVQGMDLSAVPRRSAEGVMTAALVGVALGEAVIPWSRRFRTARERLPRRPGRS